MPVIENYSFGALVVNGRRYSNDVTIVNSEVAGEWWRTQGHLCQESDLEHIFEARPRTLVLGQGSSGMMRISHDVAKRCKKLGIKLVTAPTEQAVQEFNTLSDAGENVAGAFHLTC